MFTAFLVSVSLLGASPLDDVNHSEKSTYETAKEKLGRDPKAHLKLALWCEAHGLTKERLKHLAIAAILDPKDATVRGLMGLVSFGGQWKSPEVVSEKVKADAALAAKLAEYEGRRANTPQTADGQWKLASWCNENGLKAEAQAHLTSVVRLDPSRDSAWKLLGCVKVGGRWLSQEQLAAEKAEAAAHKQGDKTWKPLLTKYRHALAGKIESKRTEAEKALAEIKDPYAVPAIWAVFAGGDAAAQVRAIQLFAQIDAPGASRALAFLAVYSSDAEVRRKATETLKNRDIRDVVGWLIALIRKPMKYEVRPVGGPGSPGVLFVEGERFNVNRLYSPPAMPNIPIFPADQIVYDQFGLPYINRILNSNSGIETRYSRETIEVTPAQYVGRAPTDAVTAQWIAAAHANPNSRPMIARDHKVWVSKDTKVVTQTPQESVEQIPIGQIMAQYQLTAMVAQQQLASDIASIDNFNSTVNASNESVGQVLRGITGHDQGPDQEAWAAWWTNQQGYVYNPPTTVPKPTVLENVPLAFYPQAVPTTVASSIGQTNVLSTSSSISSPSHSCFRAGTPVRTLSGLTPIESIEIGDQVLVQNLNTGALTFEPVLAAFHNKPAQLYKVDLGKETVWATGIHRFWKPGQGWVMARDLKSGDSLRTLGGSLTVTAVEEGPVEPVFNLEVAHGKSFFVGKLGTLVHDNSLVQPVTKPFDAGSQSTAAR